jgi:hypothetical protein
MVSEDGHMRRVRVPALSCFLFLFSSLAPSAAAQQRFPSDAPPADSFEFVALTPDQDRELTDWLRAMDKWQQYDEKWRNRPVHNGWGGIGERKPPPDAPVWLEAHCRSASEARLLDLEPRVRRGCLLVDDPRAPVGSLPSAVQAAEAPPRHSSFLTRLHLDGGWTTSSTGQRLYGVIGAHFSLVDVGRVQVFGPPGVILLSVPDAGGGRRMTIGYTWGISVRLTDMRVGAPSKNLTLFLNISKAWVSGLSNIAGGSRGFDLVGFSIAPRKAR